MPKSILTFAMLMVLTFVGNIVQGQTPDVYVEKVNDHFYLLIGGRGLGANVGVSIGDHGILLIDTFVAEHNQTLLDQIRKLSDKPIRFVINTHSDLDHSGGNDFFAEMGATIIGHHNARYSSAHSTLTIEQGFSLEFAGETVQAYHVVAHSFTDLIIYLPKSNVVFMGDTYASSWHPTFYARGVKGLFKALDIGLQLANQKTMVIPGHGLAKGKRALLSHRKDTEDWLVRVGQLHRQRASLEMMAMDVALNDIRGRFMDDNYSVDMPDERFQRFIARTLASEFVQPYPLSRDELARYSGVFRHADGLRTFEVVLEQDKLLLRQEREFLVELVPLSREKFHIRASLDPHVIFATSPSGQINQLRIVAESGEETANRISSVRAPSR